MSGYYGAKCPKCGRFCSCGKARQVAAAERTMVRIEVDPTPCIVAWPGCTEVYTTGHICDREADHQGRHRCVCGASKATTNCRSDRG